MEEGAKQPCQEGFLSLGPLVKTFRENVMIRIQIIVWIIPGAKHISAVMTGIILW